jgi:hypothetical protein
MYRGAVQSKRLPVKRMEVVAFHQPIGARSADAANCCGGEARAAFRKTA